MDYNVIYSNDCGDTKCFYLKLEIKDQFIFELNQTLHERTIANALNIL